MKFPPPRLSAAFPQRFPPLFAALLLLTLAACEKNHEPGDPEGDNNNLTGPIDPLPPGPPLKSFEPEILQTRIRTMDNMVLIPPETDAEISPAVRRQRARRRKQLRVEGLQLTIARRANADGKQLLRRGLRRRAKRGPKTDLGMVSVLTEVETQLLLADL